MFALRIHDILHAQHSTWVIYFSICGLYTYEWNRAKVWINPILVVGNNVDSFFPFTMTKEQEWRLQYVSYLVRTSYAFRKLYVSKSPTFNIFVILIQCEVFCVIHSFFFQIKNQLCLIFNSFILQRLFQIKIISSLSVKDLIIVKPMLTLSS